ncbi:MAG: phosphoribosylglycinamide formyltransferase [Planctomycetales bacterium]|nr:phosphoribosylglycinamide formyltransferase [Planctomycetales bacterium]
MADHPLRIAVLISGGGTTLKNLLRVHKRGDLPVEFVLVMSSSPTAKGLAFASDAQIAQMTIQRQDYASTADFSAAVFDACREQCVELVVMGGYLKHVVIPSEFSGRVINIHPSLIPSFCGKGYYGERVHQAVLDYGAKLSGCTVHFVDDDYDHGPIIAQRSVEVRDDDTASTLAARVFEVECQVYPEVIRQIALGRVHLEGRRVRIDAAP